MVAPKVRNPLRDKSRVELTVKGLTPQKPCSPAGAFRRNSKYSSIRWHIIRRNRKRSARVLPWELLTRLTRAG